MDLFIDLKTYYGSHTNFSGNNSTFQGSNNTLYCNNSKIEGNFNEIYGNNNVVHGSDNIVRGNINTAYGSNNKFYGEENKGVGISNLYNHGLSSVIIPLQNTRLPLNISSPLNRLQRIDERCPLLRFPNNHINRISINNQISSLIDNMGENLADEILNNAITTIAQGENLFSSIPYNRLSNRNNSIENTSRYNRRSNGLRQYAVDTATLATLDPQPAAIPLVHQRNGVLSVNNLADQIYDDFDDEDLEYLRLPPINSFRSSHEGVSLEKKDEF